MADKKLFLLDAYALIFRAYYALIRSPRITSKGKNTNAQFGFTNTLYDLIRKENPTHLAVVFDTSAPTERHTDFADYKANRQETPEDLVIAVPDIKRIIEGFNIPVMESDGFEADDVIGGLAYEAADMGYEVYMVTPDKDYGQLVRDNIFIYKPSYQGNGVEILGPKEVCEKWNIKRVDQVIDMLGLMGDSVDNIPGIPGVGEKTAAKLLAEYDTLENILANADNIKGKLGEKVRDNKDLAIMSKKLATIITNVPVNFHEENFRIDPPNKEVLREVFAELEFKTLGKRILGEDVVTSTETAVVDANAPLDLFGNPLPQAKAATLYAEVTVVEETVAAATSFDLATAATTPHEYILVQDEAAARQLADEMLQQHEIAFDTETTDIDANRADMLGMSICWQKGKAYYVALPEGKEAVQQFLQIFKPAFDKPDTTWIGQNTKY
ncbi:MAG TPA: 5'-3' exonuclease H3TH domain-containing protein, partial [Flavipsychrobacter sp.]